MVFPIVALFGLVKVACVACGAAFCVHKVTKAYNKSQKLKEKKLDYSHEERKIARENKEKAQADETEWKKKLEEIEDKERRKAKEIEELKNKLSRSDLSEEERSSYKRKLVIAQQEFDKIRNEKKSASEKVKDAKDRIDKSDKIINSTSLTDNRDKDWIWEVLTLENILVCLAIYALYNIVRDERKH